MVVANLATNVVVGHSIARWFLPLKTCCQTLLFAKPLGIYGDKLFPRRKKERKKKDSHCPPFHSWLLMSLCAFTYIHSVRKT